MRAERGLEKEYQTFETESVRSYARKQRGLLKRDVGNQINLLGRGLQAMTRPMLWLHLFDECSSNRVGGFGDPSYPV